MEKARKARLLIIPGKYRRIFNTFNPCTGVMLTSSGTLRHGSIISAVFIPGCFLFLSLDVYREPGPKSMEPLLEWQCDVSSSDSWRDMLGFDATDCIVLLPSLNDLSRRDVHNTRVVPPAQPINDDLCYIQRLPPVKPIIQVSKLVVLVLSIFLRSILCLLDTIQGKVSSLALS